MNDKIKIFEGIIDPAAREYLNDNIKDYASVQNYALNACEINLTSEDAEKIRELILQLKKRWDGGEIVSGDDYHQNFIKPLE